jgi:t-SNARE complex subunit (syntaxin)
VGFIILFIIVLIVVLAFKPSKKVETITRKDVETGKTIIEERVTHTSSAVKTAAKIAVGFFTFALVLFLLFGFCVALI